MIEINKTYGSWIVLKESNKNTKYGKFYDCLCGSCNKSILSLKSSDLESNKRSVCYSCYQNKIKKYPDYISTTRKNYFSQVKSKAKKRKISFNLNIVDVYKLLEKQNYKCKISGQYIDIDSEEKTASLDRIDSGIGYIITNVQWVDKKINYMKGPLDLEELLSLCKMIIKNNKNGNK